MIKREIIEKHLEDMATRVGRLRRYQQLSSEEFTTDWQAIYAAERGLQTAIQNLIDIGAHILAGLGDSQWNEYREIRSVWPDGTSSLNRTLRPCRR
jgi:uncharacterized protein YutE (UPF0331/DUF86 family)